MSRPKSFRRGGATRIIAGIIAGLLALLMLGSFLVGSLTIGAITQADVDRAKAKLAAATAEKQALQKELNALSNDKSKVREQITALDNQIAKAEEEIVLQEELIEQLRLMISAKTIELEDSQQEENSQYEKSRMRIRFMAEQGNTSYLSILLSADSFGDFLSRYEVVKQISGYDAQVFDALKAIREQVATQKRELEENHKLEAATKVEMDAAKQALEAQLSDKNKAMQSILSSEAQTQEAYKKMIEEEEAAVAEVKKKQAELAAAQAKSFIGGAWLWPLSGDHTTITCKYGYRTHPVTGKKNSLHTGTDIRAASGTKIYASNGGKVVTSVYNSAYGNYVIIDHGGGYMTLYAHMKSLGVAEGTVVNRGDVIGYVGSTGYSTGPHLHFEIIKDGKTYDPLTEFKGVKFTYS